MIPPETDRGASSSPSPNGFRGSDDPQATTTYIPESGQPTAATQQSAGSRRFDFLGLPRAEGELGWLAHYRVQSLIGEGGIGLVFLAEDTHLSRPVALKVIKPELASVPRVRSRFVREAQATAAIKHDHIVTIYQVGQDGDVLFLAMEYLQGLSLQSWLERSRKPSMGLVLRIGREIAAGLAAAHRHGLIHRDIKPANIWLEVPSARVKILDFGMARSERDDVQITHSGTVIGTPAYMAPEQARGEVVGAASDLFSLGCVIYRLCAGRLPFQGETIITVLSALASETPRSPREIDPDVRPELDELVMRLLAKNPSNRPASAQDVVEAIRTIERELLSERQEVETSDDAQRLNDAAVLDLHEVVNVGGPRLEPRDGRGKWRMAAVVSAVAAVVGVFAITRPGRNAHQTAARQATSAPALDAPALGAATATNDEAPPTSRRVGHDRSTPEVARASIRGGDAPAPAGPSTSDASNEGHQVANLHDAIEQPAEDRPVNIPDMQEGGKAGQKPPTSMPPPPPVAVASAGEAPSRDDWGDPVDPDGDCTFDLDRSRNVIRIAVPGTPHVLSAEFGRLNAPRLLQPVRGDFDASVSVTGVFHPAGRATMKEYAPYHGAGIILWQDERNYVRLEIAADVHRGKPRSYANFELRKAGALAVSKGLAIKDGSTRLRLERRGDEVYASFGPDGVRWTSFPPLTVEFDDRLSVGIMAINSAAKPLGAGLKSFAITRRSQPGDDGREGNDNP